MKQLTLSGVAHRFALDQVLLGIDLQLAQGESIALVGPSGCGKTTLLNLVAGLLTLTEGRIDNGFVRHAYVFQQPRLLPWKSACDNIALGLKAQRVPADERRARAQALALKLGLESADLDKYPQALSGGMQSRVALARALVLEPDLLLLDEPFAALDVGLKAELYSLLLEQMAERHCAMLMITHDLMEAVRLADRVVMMAPQPGRLVREFRLALPQRERDEGWVYATTGEMMRAREVRAGFGLPPLPDAGAGDQSPCVLPLRASQGGRRCG